jgi:hypothetical protein
VSFEAPNIAVMLEAALVQSIYFALTFRVNVKEGLNVPLNSVESFTQNLAVTRLVNLRFSASLSKSSRHFWKISSAFLLLTSISEMFFGTSSLSSPLLKYLYQFINVIK